MPKVQELIHSVNFAYQWCKHERRVGLGQDRTGFKGLCEKGTSSAEYERVFSYVAHPPSPFWYDRITFTQSNSRSAANGSPTAGPSPASVSAACMHLSSNLNQFRAERPRRCKSKL